MRGESDRECRARGGGVTKDDRRKVKRAFKSTAPTGETPDATLTRGAGPLFRADGGAVAKADGGAVARKRGGKVEGGAKKPHMGRAGRARGGGVGSDLKPLTSAAHPSKPKDRRIMPDSEKTPQ
jgi:hypothetical protein